MQYYTTRCADISDVAFSCFFFTTTKPRDVKAQLKTLEKTLADHLKKRGGIDMPETWRIRCQIDFLKKLLGL